MQFLIIQSDGEPSGSLLHRLESI